MSAAMTKEERERLIGRIEAGLRHPSRVEFVLALDRAATELRRTADYDELRARLDAALSALKGLSDMYTHAWDLADGGGLIMSADSIPRFEAAHKAAWVALGNPPLIEDDETDAALSPTDAGVTTRGGGE